MLTPTAQRTQQQREGYAQGTPQASWVAGERGGEAGLVSEQRVGQQAEEASREGTEDRDIVKLRRDCLEENPSV